MSSPSPKNILLSIYPKSWFDPPIPSQRGDASRSSWTSGAGCGGRVGLQHDFHADERSDATVKSRGSGIPVLMPRAMRLRIVADAMMRSIVAKRGQDSRSPGRARISRNTIAQGRSGCSRPNLWYLPPAFFVAGGPWERPAPDLPCALTLPEGNESSRARAKHAARTKALVKMQERVSAECVLTY